jgi:hypothetical protein
MSRALAPASRIAVVRARWMGYGADIGASGVGQQANIISRDGAAEPTRRAARRGARLRLELGQGGIGLRLRAAQQTGADPHRAGTERQCRGDAVRIGGPQLR